jgi:hypothetical protein
VSDSRRQSDLKLSVLADYFDAWEAEHGLLTVEELATAADELGVPRSTTANPAA